MKKHYSPSSVSIVIPNYNGRELLAKNLPLIIKAAKGAEVIVVDDASTDDSVALLENDFPEVKLVKQVTNQRFAAASNSGVEVATGEIVVLFNTDVVPETDFLATLLPPFSDPKVFAVGCKEIEENEGQTLIQGRGGGDFKRGLMIHWKADDQMGLDTLWVFGGSGAYRKSIWEELGGFDPLFTPAYEEDRDLSYRALKRGYKLIFSPESIVHHQHESTNMPVLGTNTMQSASYKNHLIIVWKNITHIPYLLSHVLWLPYHLVITTIKSRGLFLSGFFQALSLFPQVIRKRKVEVKEATVNDTDIFKEYSQV